MEMVRPGPGERRPLLRTLVGEVLRRHRQEQKRTLAEVAREACVSVPYLSEVERGRKEPSSEVLAAVCDSLHIELSDLLGEVRRSLVGEREPARVFQLDLARREAAQRDTARRDTARFDIARRRPVQRQKPQANRSGDVMLLAA
jgi:transcriptional regulator with XRE-family HTH domain